MHSESLVVLHSDSLAVVVHSDNLAGVVHSENLVVVHYTVLVGEHSGVFVETYGDMPNCLNLFNNISGRLIEKTTRTSQNVYSVQ